jgi:hypothetical protein
MHLPKDDFHSRFPAKIFYVFLIFATCATYLDHTFPLSFTILENTFRKAGLKTWYYNGNWLNQNTAFCAKSNAHLHTSYSTQTSTINATLKSQTSKYSERDRLTHPCVSEFGPCLVTVFFCMLKIPQIFIQGILPLCVTIIYINFTI